VTINPQEQATAYLKSYNLSLPEAWAGRRDLWHMWHSPTLIYRGTFANFCERVIEICENKPEHEKKFRLERMKPVQHVFASEAVAAWKQADAAWEQAGTAWDQAYAARDQAYAARQAAHAAWKQAYAAWEQARAAWDQARAALDQADAALDQAVAAWKQADAALDQAGTAWDQARAAWDQADAAWKQADAVEIMAAHKAECPGCGWDGHEMKLPEPEEHTHD